MVNQIKKNRFLVVRSSERISPTQVQRGKWEPYFSDFVQKIANRFSTSEDFYIEEVHDSIPNFFDHHNNHLTKPTTFALIGGAGIGKTSFIKNWLEKSDIAYAYFNANDLEEDNDTEMYVLRHLINELQYYRKGEALSTLVSQKIQEIQVSAMGQTYEDFARKFINQSNDFKKDFPRYNEYFVLATLISSISEGLGLKTWLVLDNADLQGVDVQLHYFKTSYKLRAVLNDINKYFDWKGIFHIVVPIRKETQPLWKGVERDYQDITYENKSVVSIFERKLSKSIKQAVNDCGSDRKINLRVENIYFKNPYDIGIYITEKSIRYLRDNIWPQRPMNFDMESWHMNLVNHNVRRLINFWVHFLLSGNYIDLIFDNRIDRETGISYHTYQRKLFRGRYNEFPGNRLFDANGESPDSPIVINLFGDKYGYPSNESNYIQHYYLNIRILQYLSSTSSRRYLDLHSDLVPFFEYEKIEDSVKWLLWVRLIEEENLGIRNIGGYKNYNQIQLRDDAILCCTDASNFYLNELLNNYEYLLAMAIVSYQIKNEFNSSGLRTHFFFDCVGLGFSISLVQILQENFNEYSKTEGMLEKFYELFINRSNSHPVKQSIDTAMQTIQRKMYHWQDDREKYKELQGLKKCYDELEEKLDKMVKVLGE